MAAPIAAGLETTDLYSGTRLVKSSVPGANDLDFDNDK